MTCTLINILNISTMGGPPKSTRRDVKLKWMTLYYQTHEAMLMRGNQLKNKVHSCMKQGECKNRVPLLTLDGNGNVAATTPATAESKQVDDFIAAIPTEAYACGWWMTRFCVGLAQQSAFTTYSVVVAVLLFCDSTQLVLVSTQLEVAFFSTTTVVVNCSVLPVVRLLWKNITQYKKQYTLPGTVVMESFALRGVRSIQWPNLSRVKNVILEHDSTWDWLSLTDKVKLLLTSEA